MTVVRIPPPYTSFNQVKTFRYGEIIFDLDISPDGELVSAPTARSTVSSRSRCGNAPT